MILYGRPPLTPPADARSRPCENGKQPDVAARRDGVLLPARADSRCPR